MRLDIVNHSHNYSRCLIYQLSSLVLFPPKTTDLRYYLFHTADDTDTLAVIDHFKPLMPCEFVTIPQDIGVLRNRAAGRNQIAKSTTADWVWFTDTDYLFRKDCLDKLGSIVDQRWGHPPKEIDICFPRRVLVTHQEEGDRLINAVDQVAVFDVPDKSLWPYKMGVAIGGIQIASGSTCRNGGYVPGMAHEKSNTWNFCSDKRFRYQVQIRHSIDLPNVCRIRHLTRGYKEIGTKL
jgi:hypothetical protein